MPMAHVALVVAYAGSVTFCDVGKRAMHTTNLPTVAPQWAPRRVTAAEIAQLAYGDDVPGIDPHHPIVRELRALRLGNRARVDFGEARRRGFLVVRTFRNCAPAGDTSSWDLRTLWSTWCAAAAHPEITIHGTDALSLRCSLAPTGRVWAFASFPVLARALAPVSDHRDARWTITPELVEVHGLDMPDALELAARLVDLGTSDRFLRDIEIEPKIPDTLAVSVPGGPVPFMRADQAQ